LPTENLTAPVLFRVIEASRPTVLADEYDSWLRDNEALRGMLNAGHKRGGQALRCQGEDNEVRAFRVFAPAVLCGIGALPGTLHDRSIGVRLTRAKPGEVQARFDSRRVDAEKTLCSKLARWARDNFKRLESCDPVLPPQVFNRLADNWRPLFAIAEAVGGDWPKRAANAFAKLTDDDDSDGHGIGTMLLGDISEMLGRTGGDRIFSRDLVSALNEMKERPWPEAHHRGPISESWLARRLRAFSISPKTMRIGEERLKGYEAADFRDAFDRFLPEARVSNRDTVTTRDFTGEKPTFGSVTPQDHVTDSNTDETLGNIDLSRCHGSKDPEPQELLL
jgi:hypothetical protein